MSVLVVEVAGQQVPLAGEPLEWLSRQAGYASVEEMIADPQSRKRVSVEQLVFASEQMANRETRRRRRWWRR